MGSVFFGLCRSSLLDRNFTQRFDSNGIKVPEANQLTLGVLISFEIAQAAIGRFYYALDRAPGILFSYSARGWE